MKAYVYCVPGKNSWHSFYLQQGQEKYYLFAQRFRRGVQNFYGKRVRLDKAVDYSCSHRDSAIIRTMHKLFIHIRSLETEYDIVLLDRTQKQLQGRRGISCSNNSGKQYMQNNVYGIEKEDVQYGKYI